MTVTPPFEMVSHYRLVELLGRGAMGEVWLAEDTHLPRRVAVKLLPKHLAEDSEAVERLLREARAAARVDHPNVVTVLEAGMLDGQPFLVMQRVVGETLERRLERGPMPAAEAIAMITAIADALAEVHALGIVHRDLKPANIMVTPRGPKVLDFGIAAVRGSARMTNLGFAVGTPLFMSPEQLRGGPADQRADLWALGVIFYQALTGTLPFEGDDVGAVARAVLGEAPPRPSERNAAIPGRLDWIVGKLMQKDPGLRYARAEDLIADLAARTEERTPDADAASEVTLAVAAIAPRLAVLDFELLSGDPDDVFLAAGLTEDLSVDLARVEGLRVAARGEVLAFRGRNLPPRTVARELGVDFVVQGSVRRAGQRARISAHLVRASDGHAVWAERFDRTLEDLFDVQAEVSRSIVDALQVTLRPDEREMLDRAPTKNREAYALYLRGRALLDQSGREHNQRAGHFLEQAIELDPRFALAHAALAECYAHRVSAWWAGLEMTAIAAPHARRAIELDPKLPQARLALAAIHRLEGNAVALLEELRAAQGLESNDPVVLRSIGWSYMTLGRPEEALEILERAHRSHPRDYRIVSSLVDCCAMLGRKEEEERLLGHIRELLFEALDRDPGNVDARGLLCIALAQSGERAAGIVQAEQVLAMAPGDGRVRYNTACAFVYAGLPERAIEQLRIMVGLVPSYLTDWVRKDPDLAPLRQHPEFVRMFGAA